MIFNLNIVDLTIVLRPARSKAQVPGFDRVSFFFKSKRCRFSKKNKNQRVCNRVLPGQPAGSAEFFLTLFFLQPGPVPAPSRPARPGRVSKLWI